MTHTEHGFRLKSGFKKIVLKQVLNQVYENSAYTRVSSTCGSLLPPRDVLRIACVFIYFSFCLRYLLYFWAHLGFSLFSHMREILFDQYNFIFTRSFPQFRGCSTRNITICTAIFIIWIIKTKIFRHH